MLYICHFQQTSHLLPIRSPKLLMREVVALWADDPDAIAPPQFESALRLSGSAAQFIEQSLTPGATLIGICTSFRMELKNCLVRVQPPAAVDRHECANVAAPV